MALQLKRSKALLPQPHHRIDSTRHLPWGFVFIEGKAAFVAGAIGLEADDHAARCLKLLAM